MAICYCCGSEIRGRPKKRKLQTGQWVRRSYDRERTTAVHTHYGIRVVCSRCAFLIDREQVRKERRAWLEIGALLAVLLVLLGFVFAR